MKRYIIACRFGHAFVARAWVSESKKHPGLHLFGIVKNWRDLEAPAIETVQAYTGGAWPVQGCFRCPARLSENAQYNIRAMLTRTRARRLMAELEQHQAARPPQPAEGTIEIMAEQYGRSVSYQLYRKYCHYWDRAENWRDLRAEAKAAFVAKCEEAPAVRQYSILCPPELAALAIWPPEVDIFAETEARP